MKFRSKKKKKGQNVIVEIDESKFGQRKYNRGHRIEGIWIVEDVEQIPGFHPKIILSFTLNVIVLEPLKKCISKCGTVLMLYEHKNHKTNAQFIF